MEDYFKMKKCHELKECVVSFRVRPSVKKDFLMLCKMMGYSQSDMFELLVRLGKEKFFDLYPEFSADFDASQVK